MKRFLRKGLLFIVFFCNILTVFAEGKNVHVVFVPTWNGKEIRPDETCFFKNSTDSIRFETLRFYLSSVSFYKDGKIAFSEAESFHLIDFSENNSLAFSLTVPKDYDEIGFNLGIDSAMSTSGAHGGALDPALGMYWAWQSGYINMKIEGESNLAISRKHAFQFHLGGYASPNNALQYVRRKAGNTDSIIIELPLDKLFGTVDLSRQNMVMIPGREAVQLSETISHLLLVR